jgi:DNA-binding NtrC family response regulator
LASASNPGTKTSPARILVVEDEALVAMLIEDELFELGFDVVGPAATVSHALALCHDERIDGAVLDVNLGGGQRSDSVADFLLSKRIPFVFVTGYGDAGVSVRFADRAVLQKPFALPDLRRLVERNFESFEAPSKSARCSASG